MSGAVELPGTRLGLLSDSHADVPATRAGVRLLLDAGADAILHLGDVCAAGIVDELAGLTNAAGAPVPARLVFGNMDDDVPRLTAYAESLGVGVDHPAGRLSMGGRTIVTHHGHLPEHRRHAVQAGVDFYIQGHTHKPLDGREGDTRLINPGALHRARPRTVAMLDLTTGELVVTPLPGQGGAD